MGRTCENDDDRLKHILHPRDFYCKFVFVIKLVEINQSFNIGFKPKVDSFTKKPTNREATVKYIQWTNSIRVVWGTERINTRPRIVSTLTAIAQAEINCTWGY